MLCVRLLSLLLLLSTSGIALAQRPASLPAQWLDWQTLDHLTADRLCYGQYVAPVLDRPEAHLPLDQARLFAQGREAYYPAQGDARLIGDVRLRKGPLYLTADQAQINQARTQAQLQGQLVVRDNDLLLRAEEGHYDLQTGEMQLFSGHYVFHDQHLRGSAWQLRQTADDRVELVDASLTSCAPDDRAWQLVAERIHLNRESGFGDAYHVRLQVREVPVFYWPWLRFPIDDQRHTGFLYPDLAYSHKNGAYDLLFPFYWNLAPHYDMTFYPRQISDRGSMLGTELRYLQPRDQGEVFYAFLLSDDRYHDLDRWQLSLYHQGQRHGLNYTLDFSQVSDDAYFSDLGNGPFNRVDDDRLLQTLRLDYRYAGWQGRLQWRGYHRVRASNDPNTAADAGQTYRLLDLRQGRNVAQQDYFYWPQLEIRRQDRLTPRWRSHLLMDLARFDRLFDREVSDRQDYQSEIEAPPTAPNDFYINRWGAPRADRLHLAAGVQGDWSWPWAFVRPALTLKHTQYQLDPYWQDAAPSVQRNAVELSPSASVPVLSLDTGLFLERDASLLGRSFLQTLEPRLFVAHVPYVEQYQIPPIFDGRFSGFSVNQLYRAERTTGRDRVGDVSKVTFGVQQRLLSAQTGRELAGLHLAQEFYWSDRYLDNRSIHPDAESHPRNQAREARPYSLTRERSNLVVEANWRPLRQLELRTTYLWDDHFQVTDQSHTRATWSDPSGMQLNLGHVYRSNYLRHRRNELTGPAPDRSLMDDYSYRELAEEQYYVSGILPSWHPRWRFFFKHALDWKRSEVLDTLGGLEYTSCCWQLQLVYRDWVKDPNVRRDYNDGFEARERDRGIFLQINLRGLGGAGQSTADLLRDEIPGYTNRR